MDRVRHSGSQWRLWRLGHSTWDEPTFFVPAMQGPSSDAALIPPICLHGMAHALFLAEMRGALWCDACRGYLQFCPMCGPSDDDLLSEDTMAAYDGRGTASCNPSSYEDPGEICLVEMPSIRERRDPSSVPLCPLVRSRSRSVHMSQSVWCGRAVQAHLHGCRSLCFKSWFPLSWLRAPGAMLWRQLRDLWTQPRTWTKSSRQESVSFAKQTGYMRIPILPFTSAASRKLVLEEVASWRRPRAAEEERLLPMAVAALERCPNSLGCTCSLLLHG